MFKFLLSLLIFIKINGYSQKKDSILYNLEENIKIKDEYQRKKYENINKLINELNQHIHEEGQIKVYDDYISLYKEYQSFRCDSAYYYIEKAKTISRKEKNTLKLSKAKIKEGFILMSSGLFSQALDTLNSIDFEILPNKLKYEYHSVKARTYFDWADYISYNRYSYDYINRGNNNLEKALLYTKPNTNEYWSIESLRLLKAQDWEGAKKAFETWINHYKIPKENYAIALSSLAHVYDENGFEKNNIQYLALAAIEDLKNSTKETVALRNLAQELFKMGDLKKAYKYIAIAMDDATFYNARHRKVELSTILPIIEKAQIHKTEQQNSLLQKIIIVLSILALLVVIFLIIIFEQLKAIKISRKILAHSNHQLKELNEHLREVDSIKQEYIAYFLKISSDFIYKIDQIQKSTFQKIKAKKPEELLTVLKKYSVKKARAHLFQQFDEVFLKLFPTFLEDFYDLFPESERTQLKTDKSLNNELRIFALYRLGVQDSGQVAAFLELSVATVYSYKTRVKNKSNFKDNFEEKIMDIKQF